MSLAYFAIEAILLSSGIITNKKYKKYEPYLIAGLIANSVTFIVTVLICILTSPHIRDQILLLSYLGGVCSYFVLQYITRLNEPALLYLAKELRKNLKDDDFISTYTKTRMEKLFYPQLIALLTTTNTILFSPMLLFILSRSSDTSDPNFYLLMHTITFWHVDSTVGLIVKNLLHIFMVLPGTFCYLCSTVMIAFIASNLEAHAAQVNSRIDDIMKMAQPGVLKINPMQRHILMTKELKSLIRYLQYIFRYSRSFTSYVEWIVHTCLFWFMNGLILILHVLIQAEDPEIVVIIKNFAILTLVFLQFFICCSITESLSHLNENLLLSMYNSAWYEATPQIRKILLTMMLHWQCPLQIKLFNMYCMNLGLFARCFRIIYSVLNVTSRVYRR